MSYFLHILLFSLIYFGFFFPIYHHETRERSILHCIIFTYLCIVLSLTIIPLTIPQKLDYSFSEISQAINFIPFRDVMYGYRFAKREAFFNIVMMIPFGILIPLLTNKKWIATTIAVALFSMTIETSQLFTILFQMDKARIVDVTDIITNTIGGICGYFLLHLFKKVKQKIPYRCSS